MDKRATTTDKAPAHIPEGFVSITTPNGEICVVPEFLIPATNQAFDGFGKKMEMDIENEIGGSRNSVMRSFVFLSEDNVVLPADPHLTERELLGYHTEIIALQDRYGISYKDASHRLYMAEWEKLKGDERTHKAFSNLSSRTHDALTHFKRKLEELGNDPVDK